MRDLAQYVYEHLCANSHWDEQCQMYVAHTRKMSKARADRYYAKHSKDPRFIALNRARVKSYYEENREVILAKRAAYYAANRELLVARARRYYDANIERRRAYARKRRAAKKTRSKC